MDTIAYRGLPAFRARKRYLLYLTIALFLGASVYLLSYYAWVRNFYGPSKDSPNGSFCLHYERVPGQRFSRTLERLHAPLRWLDEHRYVREYDLSQCMETTIPDFNDPPDLVIQGSAPSGRGMPPGTQPTGGSAAVDHTLEINWKWPALQTVPPDAALRCALQRGDKRLLAIQAFSTEAPGTEAEPELMIQQGVHYIYEPGDAGVTDQQSLTLDQARIYAGKYNRLLLKALQTHATTQTSEQESAPTIPANW